MTARQFLALWPDQDAVEDLARHTLVLRRESPRWLRWQSPQRWHVTLLFLGEREVSAQRLRKTAGRIAEEVTPTPLRLKGSGSFGPILWVGVEAGPWLAGLAKSLSGQILPGERPERFRAHVTVARARNRSLPTESVSALATYVGTPWQPRELALVRSTIGPEPKYEITDAFPFGG